MYLVVRDTSRFSPRVILEDGISFSAEYYAFLSTGKFTTLAGYNTIEEARACAKAIAAFENVPLVDYTT